MGGCPIAAKLNGVAQTRTWGVPGGGASSSDAT
jgi:hypothetical protein